MLNDYFKEYLDRINAVSLRVESEFSTLSVSQLNWKSAPDRWSIAQCLHHLITTNKSYFSTLRKLEADTFENGFWERFSPFSGYFGNMLKKSMITPPKERKMKSPSLWQPSQSDLTAEIIDDFLANQKELLSLLHGIEDRNHAAIKISSPAASFLTYSLKDAVIVIATHEERHLAQALEVKKLQIFQAS